ncbi:MAG: GHKL domain-containing protein [Clostridia bacterium]|nr:GHKL domain-containing protein [Clostridia bacterium]
MRAINNIMKAVTLAGGVGPFIGVHWLVVLRVAILAAFIAAVSGKNVRIVRRIAVAAATVALLFAAEVFTNNGDLFSTYYDEICELAFMALLFLSSLACGEKSPFRAMSFSLIAVNVTTAAEAVMMGTLSAQRPANWASSRTALSKTQYIIAFAAAAVVLLAAAIFFRKFRADLERREKVAMLTSLFVITAMIMLTKNILQTNVTYSLLRIITVSSTKRTVVFTVVILASLLLLNAAVYVLFVRMSARQKEKAEQAVLTQKLEGQSAIIEEVSKQHEKVSRMRHDLLNTLGTVDGLIASGRTDEAREYIRAHTGVLSSDVRTVNTDNEYVNSIISYKTSQAKEKGVDVSVYAAANIDFPDNADLCNLIGNMLDNGISAAEKCEREKNVRLDIRRDGQSWRISVLNSVTSPVLKSNPGLETTSSDKLSHGFGTKIIREIAEKYYGTTDWYDTDDGRFCCSAVLYPAKPF